MLLGCDTATGNACRTARIVPVSCASSEIVACGALTASSRAHNSQHGAYKMVDCLDPDAHCKCNTLTGPSLGYSISRQGESTQCFNGSKRFVP